MTDPQTKFMDLPAEAFPFVIDFFRESDGEIVHTITVEGPGVLAVPAMIKHGRVGVRIHNV